MDYKEKYNAALRRAKKLYGEGTITECLGWVFPELKESEDEQSRKWILEYLYDGLRKSDEQFKGQFKTAIAWLEKQGEQKPAWSEEDEKQLQHAMLALQWYAGGTDITNWLLSIKERVQPQNLTITDEELIQAKKDAYNDALDKIEYHCGKPTFDDGWSAAIWYLKKRNAQPQSTWKPSDEQMKALKDALHDAAGM